MHSYQKIMGWSETVLKISHLKMHNPLERSLCSWLSARDGGMEMNRNKKHTNMDISPFCILFCLL
ncbi:MAG: hypothetical protein DRN10_03965 [Thermoplasmata archaeon]|nr:MAG: hypothetical protein DRN10_03965 [Thermoplasmata archaeon]